MQWDQSWKSKGNDVTAFIFSLNNKKKYRCTDQKSCIYSNSKYGPCFSQYCDIFIDNNSSINNNSYCIFPVYYGVGEVPDEKG